MNITAASLSQLEAGRSYYLSNTTGTIKKTTLWQWFKCLTGFGNGRAKAQRLAEVVKASLLANAFAGIQAAVDAADAAYAADGTLHDILVLPHRHRRAAFFRRACPTGDSDIINGWPP